MLPNPRRPKMTMRNRQKSIRLSGGPCRRLTAAIMAAAMIFVAGIGHAQESINPQVQDPPYEAQLLRLSEILGAIHYLRRLCDGDEGSLWRDQMQALIDAESPNLIRHARIVDKFNRGFETFRAVYRICTPAAALAINRYMEEGAQISRDITVRHGK